MGVDPIALRSHLHLCDIMSALPPTIGGTAFVPSDARPCGGSTATVVSQTAPLPRELGRAPEFGTGRAQGMGDPFDKSPESKTD
jgi:hypothetical protein